MSTVRRGEVWWFETPGEKARPVLLLTRPEALDALAAVVVVPATSVIRGLPSELASGPEHGLAKPCVFSFDNLRTVSKALLTRRITMLPDGVLDEACARLNASLGCA